MKLEESHTVELKKSVAQMNEALKSVCAFLNHRGGEVYFGVNDKGKITGIQSSDKTLRKISQIINTKIKPEFNPEIKEIIKHTFLTGLHIYALELKTGLFLRMN